MMFKQTTVFLFSLIILWSHVALGGSQQGCILNVTNHLTEKLQPVPIYNLTSYYELIVPNKGVIKLNRGDKISLLCQGPRNYLTLTNSNVTSISCFQANTVQLFNKKIIFEDIQCKKSAKGDVERTNEKCGKNKGYIFKIGFQVTKKDWLTLIEVCHVPEIGYTLYTKHVIHGKEMKYASKASNRPTFSTTGLNNDVTASIAYKRPYQKSTFNQILGSARLADNYITSKSYLARGHLAPDADFLLATSQYSTYYYINTAPQWQGVNSGSWKSIESTIRKLSESYENLDIITGTHDVLNYQDSSGTLKPIFLVAGNKIPVPKYFWKIVYDPVSKTGITFIILNDPHIEEVKDGDIFCDDVCTDSGFTNNAWRKFKTGYVFCCDITEFQKVVKSVPKLKINGILGA